MPRPRDQLHWLQGNQKPRPAGSLPPGSIRVRLAEVARAQGCVVRHGRWKGRLNVSAIVRETGLAYTTVWPLRHPERSHAITFDVLACLCAYFGCQPGELLAYTGGAAPQPFGLGNLSQERSQYPSRTGVPRPERDPLTGAVLPVSEPCPSDDATAWDYPGPSRLAAAQHLASS